MQAEDFCDEGDSMAAIPAKLRPGDKVRFVSPASTPDTAIILRQAKIIESWGLRVDFGPHAFDKKGYLAGDDNDRLADLNEALRDPSIRAVLATRGGKGSYRIADRLDFDAVRLDPKFLVGFSDIAILQMNLNLHCEMISIHAGLMPEENGNLNPESCEAIRGALMEPGYAAIWSRADELTAGLTTTGKCRGRLIGGHLDSIATSAGWALPRLDGAILLLEAVNMTRGQVDRQLTMLRNAGHLDGVAGFAVGQFTGFEMSRVLSIMDLLEEHLGAFGVPILGGLPLGHGKAPLAVPVGADAILDASGKNLSFPA
jgi:muramoyltetrapeptide carboxypeptidase